MDVDVGRLSVLVMDGDVSTFVYGHAESLRARSGVQSGIYLFVFRLWFRHDRSPRA